MFGNKLRSWMEAVRPKKKQHRNKDKHQSKDSYIHHLSKTNDNGSNQHNHHHTVTWQSETMIADENLDLRNEPKSRQTKNHGNRNGPTNSHISRYSANNLSSPESAYSTGYSTDGTSPGALPDYPLHTSRRTVFWRRWLNRIVDRLDDAFEAVIWFCIDCTDCYPDCFDLSDDDEDEEYEIEVYPYPAGRTHLTYSDAERSARCLPNSRPPEMSPLVVHDEQHILENQQEIEAETRGSRVNLSQTVLFGNQAEQHSPATGVMSPRQRNRIRTNPWLPGGVLSATPSATTSATPTPLPVRQEMKRTPVIFRKYGEIPIRYLSPVKHRRSLSSSSCSSLSGAVPFDHHFQRSLSDEEDCTLNEMMGKYDESYIYEKETDILSDESDQQTDCESDIDTGQDGGDEDDPADVELDFIDNGSYLEVDFKADNTGHCSYFVPPDVQKKRSSKKRNVKRSKDGMSQRRRSSSNKKGHNKHFEKIRHSSLHQDGSQSAGATPVSVRRSNLECSNLRTSQEDYYKKRSNSVCVQKDCSLLIEKQDKEADIKYRELIGQADQILRNMNMTGVISPRRLPAPANKRVELLKSTECTKPELPVKSVKPLEENLTVHKVPSNVTLKNSRFSPKKNHITNFIINNSPVLLKKDLSGQGQSPLVLRKNFNEESPLANKMYPEPSDTGVLYRRKVYNTNSMNTLKPPEINGFGSRCSSPVARRRTPSASPNAVRRTPICSPVAVRRPPASPVPVRRTPISPVPVMKRTPLLPKSILHKPGDGNSNPVSSPRHRRAKESAALGSSSSEEEEFQKAKRNLSKSCPQSEPVKRKVYFGRNTINYGKNKHGKTVAFNLESSESAYPMECSSGSAENLRQQALLNTLKSLKRNLENQSALQQSFRSAQNMYNYEHF